MFMKTQPLSEESMVAAINQVSENKEVNETFAGSCKKNGDIKMKVLSRMSVKTNEIQI